MKIQRLFLILFALAILSCTRQFDPEDHTLYVPLQEKVRNIDPAIAHDQYSNLVIMQAYEGLMTFNYFQKPLQLEPLLADGFPEISKDGLTYLFRIKKGVYFHDHQAFTHGKGRELTAEDFIFSWKRVADPQSKSESFWVFENKILGLSEWRKNILSGTGKFEDPIEGFKAIDTHTLKIQLTTPYYQLLYVLALPMAVALPHEVVRHYRGEIGNHAVGTGPFLLKNWLRNSQLEFVKNPKYHLKFPQNPPEKFLSDAGKPLPLSEKLVIYEIAQDQPRWLMFLKGDLDTILVPKDFMPQILKGTELSQSFKDSGRKLEFPSASDVVYVSFNTEDPILKNKKIRQAMSSAYNREIGKRDFYANLGTLAHGPIPPHFEGYRADAPSPYSKFNLQRAKELLKEAGFPQGEGLPEFVYEMASTNSTERQIAEFFKMQMSQIGIKIKLQSNTWPQFSEKISKKKAQIFMMAWNADYPDAENFLQLFYSPNSSPGPNSSNFKNRAYDDLYRKSKLLPPGPERTLIYQQMEDIIGEEVPWMTIIHRARTVMQQPWLKNYQYEQMIKNSYKYLRIDSAERAEFKKKY